MGDAADRELELSLMASLDFDGTETRRRKRLKRIADHTDEELDAAIATAVQRIPLFWKILHGVDAYMERRRRRGSGPVSPRAEVFVRQEWAAILSRAALDEEINP